MTSREIRLEEALTKMAMFGAHRHLCATRFSGELCNCGLIKAYEQAKAALVPVDNNGFVKNPDCEIKDCPCHIERDLKIDELFELEKNHPPMVGPSRSRERRRGSNE